MQKLVNSVPDFVEEELKMSDELKSFLDYQRVICISSSMQWLDVLKRTSSEPDYLKMTSIRFNFAKAGVNQGLGVLARMVLILRGACLSRREDSVVM